MSNNHRNLKKRIFMIAGFLNKLFRSEDRGIHPFRGRQGIDPKNFVIGGVAGALAGVVTALLLAPKSGKDLMNDIVHSFSHDGEHPHRTVKSKKPMKKKPLPKTVRAAAPSPLKRASRKSAKPAIAKKTPKRHTPHPKADEKDV